MPTVFVPGVASSVLKGMIGSNPWAVTHHWKFANVTAPWVQADMDLLASTIYTQWVAHLQSITGSNVNVTEVDTIDLTNSSGVGSQYTHTPTSGSTGSVIEPSSMSVVVQNKIPARYRGGHPRTYWPFYGTPDMINEYQWSAPKTVAAQNAVAAWVGSIASTSFAGGITTLQHVVPRFSYTYTNDPVHHKYTKQRSGLLAVYVVSGYLAAQKVGNQRRRLTP